jgi:glycosyltransferase involved in cell wall biosynthesis
LGYQNNVPSLYAKSNIVVLPSYREGLPKSLIEAAACGRVVVTTDVPGCRDAIEPAITGLLVPARNAMALAVALEQLIKDAETRLSMGKAGRELAEREFGIEKVVATHLEIYKELLDKCASR